MGWFSSGKRVTRKQLEQILRDTTVLSQAEREYVKGVFTKYLSDGISKEEAERAVRELKLQTGDVIDPHEADELRSRLLQLFT